MVKKTIENVLNNNDINNSIFIDNNFSFLGKVADTPTKNQVELIYIKNVYETKSKETNESQKETKIIHLEKVTNLKQLHFLKNSNFSFPRPLEKVSMELDFKSRELDFWGNTKKLIEPIIFQNYKIIEGKKVGRKLGIPTGLIISQYFR